MQTTFSQYMTYRGSVLFIFKDLFTFVMYRHIFQR